MAGTGESGGRLLLVTGRPGVGKTTVIREVAAALAGGRAPLFVEGIRGFTTEEVRDSGRRVGFRVETLDGRSAMLAHVGFRSPRRVGRYGVDVEAFEALALPELEPHADAALHVVDEIGKMECLSARFVGAVRALVESGRPLVATVALRGGGFIAEIKAHPEAELLEVTEANRDRVAGAIVTWVRRRL